VKLTKSSAVTLFVSSLGLLASSPAAAENIHCDSDRTTDIAAANLVIGAWLKAAQQELRGIRDGGDSTRFEHWFGPVTEDKLSFVDTLLYAVFSDAVPKAGYVCGPSYGCSSPDVYAWTEHGSALKDPPNYGVYVCDTWFDNEGPTEKASTLFHEYTHLYGTNDLSAADTVGSNDWEEAAHNYALNNPDQAVESAYNVEFFVEGK
jgi:hypothetical protein